MNQIQVAVDPNIEGHIEGLVLDLNEEGNSLILKGNESDCC